GAELHNLYGPTEVSIDATSWDCERDRPQRTVPISLPIANMQGHVLDEQLQPVPIGGVGELYVGGAGLAPGSLHRRTVPAELRSPLRTALPEYMIPATFITLDRLPLNANGKLDRRALPAPGHERPELAYAFTAPHTVSEELLAELWAQVLGVECVGVHD